MLRLFERLTHAEDRWRRQSSGQSLVYGDRLTPVERSVRDHLVRLLNTRRGSVQIDPEYGVPPLAAGQGSRLLSDHGRMARLLEQVISRYETRLASVQVRVGQARGADTALGCRIEGQLIPAMGADTITLDATLLSDGALVFD